MPAPPVSVILNAYRRPAALREQWEAVRGQTVENEILIWQNRGDLLAFEPLDREVQTSGICAVSNHNFGVWARFAFALNCRTEFVCVLDDDTIPGARWLENCVETMRVREGLLGTVGVIFNDPHYRSYDRTGWVNPNEEPVQTDIVGHAWFFRREWLGAFWREAQPPLHSLSGEDVHFSYSVQKYLGLNTWVPPHPPGDLSLWGSLPGPGMYYGTDAAAITSCFNPPHFGESLYHYRQKGFKFLRF